MIDWARLVPRRRIFSNVDAARDPEAFPAKSLLSDFALACVAEQLVAFIGRNSFFCLDFATRKFAGGRFHREPAYRVQTQADAETQILGSGIIRLRYAACESKI